MTDDAWREDLQRRVLQTLRAETTERLVAIDVALNGLADPRTGDDKRRALYSSLFRDVHTIKGGAQAVGEAEAAGIAHRVEALLAQSGDGTDLDRGVLPVASIEGALSVVGGLLGVPGHSPPTPDAVERVNADLDTAGAPVAPTVSGPGLFTAAARPTPDHPTRASTARVPAERLDSLIASVNELLTIDALEQRALAEIADLVARAGELADGSDRSEPIAQLYAELRRLRTSLLQTRRRAQGVIADVGERTRALRLGPVAVAWAGLPRLAREVASAVGKEIDLKVETGDLEADRAVLDAIAPPLQHLIRNAVDHGIESAAEREAAGKPALGTIVVRARHDAGSFIVEVADDGRGIDVEALQQRAVADGILPPDAGATDVLQAAFVAGLSTMPGITEVSGRGIGLDVVRTEVEALHGSIEVETAANAGTTFRLLLPFTHGTARCLMVRVGSLWLAAPVTGLVRLQRLRDGDLVASGGRLLFDDLPAAVLGDLLGTTHDAPAVAIVLRAGAEAAVLVDEVAAEVDLVVSRLPAPWRRLRFTAGAAISADGQPVVVLGVAEVARAVRRAVSADRIAVPVAADSAPIADPPPTRPVVVIVDDSATSLTLESVILDHAGYDVRTALDGIEALTIVEAGGVDAVVADLQMPQLNGFELCERLRADPRFTTLPIVLVTSSASPTDRARGMIVGADAYMVKAGFDQTQLVDLLRTLVGL